MMVMIIMRKRGRYTPNLLTVENTLYFTPTGIAHHIFPLVNGTLHSCKCAQIPHENFIVVAPRSQLRTVPAKSDQAHTINMWPKGIDLTERINVP
jgi:hypothetical protein